ncbi:MAG: hypothetical protein QM772_11575 [Ottowia sp.]|uniref:hypothetical protein n=1 Tax=Ottowia sp. TaxID=1898956 RepID=UPI0039E6E211
MNISPSCKRPLGLAAPLVAAACIAGALSSAPAFAVQKPPAERGNLDPSARNKVGTALSRSRIEREDGKRQVDEQMSSGVGGKNCTTNIGSSPSAKPEVGQRYGAGDKGSQVVVVRGPVINVCK